LDIGYATNMVAEIPPQTWGKHQQATAASSSGLKRQQQAAAAAHGRRRTGKLNPKQRAESSNEHALT
jgi:hypothetical protein